LLDNDLKFFLTVFRFNLSDSISNLKTNIFNLFFVVTAKLKRLTINILLLTSDCGGLLSKAFQDFSWFIDFIDKIKFSLCKIAICFSSLNFLLAPFRIR